MPKKIDYSLFVGQTFNSLCLMQDLGFHNTGKCKSRLFVAKCLLCNNEKQISLYEVRSGRIKSCGCVPPGAKHGKCYTNVYKAYSGIKTRCYNKQSVAYKNYGDRGITMCDEWKNDFNFFYDWAINNGYADGLEIDRINVNGNYEPDNCRWATPLVQSRNRRSNKYIEYNGERLTYAEWSYRLSSDRHLVGTRIKNGWDEISAITKPVKCTNK